MAEPYLKVHQSRARAPSDYENLLGDALEASFAAGIHELAGIAAKLEHDCVPAPDGQPWTAELLAKELKRLGA